MEDVKDAACETEVGEPAALPPLMPRDLPPFLPPVPRLSQTIRERAEKHTEFLLPDAHTPPGANADAASRSLLARLEEEEQRAIRTRRRISWGLFGLVVLAAPFLYLWIALDEISFKSLAMLTAEPPEIRKAREAQAARAARLGEAADPAHSGLDPVAVDLARYLLVDLPPLRAEEKKTLKQYRETLRRETDRGALARAIHEEVLPAYRQYLDHANALTIATPEVLSLHQLRLQSARERLTALSQIALAAAAAQSSGAVVTVGSDATNWREAALRSLSEERNSEAKFEWVLEKLKARHPLTKAVVKASQPERIPTHSLEDRRR